MRGLYSCRHPHYFCVILLWSDGATPFSRSISEHSIIIHWWLKSKVLQSQSAVVVGLFDLAEKCFVEKSNATCMTRDLPHDSHNVLQAIISQRQRDKKY